MEGQGHSETSLMLLMEPRGSIWWDVAVLQRPWFDSSNLGEHLWEVKKESGLLQNFCPNQEGRGVAVISTLEQWG